MVINWQLRINFKGCKNCWQNQLDDFSTQVWRNHPDHLIIIEMIHLTVNLVSILTRNLRRKKNFDLWFYDQLLGLAISYNNVLITITLIKIVLIIQVHVPGDQLLNRERRKLFSSNSNSDTQNTILSSW